MEVCSMHHAESQGYEMRVSSLLDTLPEYKNFRKGHPKGLGPCQGSLPRSLTPPVADMKRTHSERDGNRTSPSSPATSCLTTKIKQKLTAHVQHQQSTTATQVMKSEKCELQTSCNNNGSSEVTDCEIFLGGSCNPTSWRKDIAIPILNHSGISFYNPQVSSWYPELMKLENEAKDLANCLFFVIDSETRAVAALVEVAYLIAQGKNIILAITGLPLPGNIICGEPIKESEIQELASARSLVRQLSSRNNIRVFECIRTAVQTTAGLLRHHDDEQGSEVGGHKVNVNGRVTGLECRPITCSVAATNQVAPNPAAANQVAPSQFLPIGPTKFDVFLGGSCLTDEAIGHLRKSGVSSWTLTSDDKSSLLADPRTNDTKILFFYLSSSSRELETLILAAYFVGLSKNVVLCIEKLEDGCVIGDEVLSEIAIKDYNRGRCYLRDAAARHKVPVCSSLAEAMDTIVAKTKSPQSAS